MFAVFRLRYIRQYTIQFKLSYIYELLTSNWVHTYITHIYQRSIKIKKHTAKQWNKKTRLRNIRIFRYVKRLTHKFEVNYENSMYKYV